MNWLSSNWLWLALAGGALAFFAFGRGGCGMGHSGQDHHRRAEGDQYDPRPKTTVAPLSTPAARADARALPSTSHGHNAPPPNEGALVAENAGHDSSPGHAGPRRHRHGC